MNLELNPNTEEIDRRLSGGCWNYYYSEEELPIAVSSLPQERPTGDVSLELLLL